jgi:hypothetical protein
MAIGNDGKEHPVVLYFELSYFTVLDESNPTPYRFRLNSVENAYCKKDHVKCGAYDFILLLAHTTAFENENLEEYCMNGIQLLCRDLWEDDHVPLRITKEVLAYQENRWIYQLLSSLTLDWRLILINEYRQVMCNLPSGGGGPDSVVLTGGVLTNWSFQRYDTSSAERFKILPEWNAGYTFASVLPRESWLESYFQLGAP